MPSISRTGIELIDEKNGEVKKGEFDNEEVWYVDTDDGDDVDLETDGKPAYYKCHDDSDEMSLMPKMGDEYNLLSLLMLLVMLIGLSMLSSMKRAIPVKQESLELSSVSDWCEKSDMAAQKGQVKRTQFAIFRWGDTMRLGGPPSENVREKDESTRRRDT